MEQSYETSEVTVPMDIDESAGSHNPGLPAEIKDVFEVLCYEITQLHSKWDTCEQLFREPESVLALTEVAPGAFRVIWQTFRDDFITTVYRITDKKEFGNGKKARQNLTLAQLNHTISLLGDLGFHKKLTVKLEEIGVHCKPIQDVRVKIVGHLDMATILQPTSNPLPNVTWEDLRKALELLAEFMNEISIHFTRVHIDFVPIVTGPARNIVYGLREFKRLQKLEYEQQQAELRAEIERSANRFTHDPSL